MNYGYRHWWDGRDGGMAGLPWDRCLNVGYSFEFEAFCAEVDEKSDLQVVRLKVVDGLRKMDVLQQDNGLQFNTNTRLLPGNRLFSNRFVGSCNKPAFRARR